MQGKPISMALNLSDAGPLPVRRRFARAPIVPPDLREALIGLVSENPRRFLPHECVALLAGAGAPPEIRREPRYGSCADAGRGAIERTLRALLNEEELELCRSGRLKLGAAVAAL